MSTRRGFLDANDLRTLGRFIVNIGFPALICTADVRRAVSDFFTRRVPGLSVVSYQEIDPRVMSRFTVGTPDQNDEPIILRVGKYGPFLEQGERRASLPDEQSVYNS